MNQDKTLNLNSDFLNDFTGLFVKLVVVILILFTVILILNFLSEKFLGREIIKSLNPLQNLLFILNKLFLYAGLGFIVSNIFQFILNESTKGNNSLLSFGNFGGKWEYLTFGIILLFISFGFKSANKSITSNKNI